MPGEHRPGDPAQLLLNLGLRVSLIMCPIPRDPALNKTYYRDILQRVIDDNLLLSRACVIVLQEQILHFYHVPCAGLTFMGFSHVF